MVQKCLKKKKKENPKVDKNVWNQQTIYIEKSKGKKATRSKNKKHLNDKNKT